MTQAEGARPCEDLSAFKRPRQGGPNAGLIENADTRSSDYKLSLRPRPGHAAYTRYIRYKGFNDPRGGGAFSRRLTAPLTFAGAGKADAVKPGVTAGSHNLQIVGYARRGFDPVGVGRKRWPRFMRSLSRFVGLCGVRMADAVMQAAKEAIRSSAWWNARFGLPAGWGDPFFNSLESDIASFSFRCRG
jgi:chorismate synthase